MILKSNIFLLCFLFWASTVVAQAPYPGCPNVQANPADPNAVFANDTLILDCGVACTDLEATFLETGETTTYKVDAVPYNPPFAFTGGTRLFVNQDDEFSGIINLPFDFCFYDNSYNRLVVGANGLISFDVGLAGAFCQWSFGRPIPSPQNGGLGENGPYELSVHGAYHDIDPTVNSPNKEINYSILGTPPCRTFVVSWNNIGHFSCNNLRTTQQIVLYENTNAIEVYIKDKPTCGGWNDGNAVIGIQNGDASAGIAPPGRNTGAWTATNEAWRFTPDGAPNYQISWTDETGAEVGTDPILNVCPTDPAGETFSINVAYTNCNGNVVNVNDNITVISRPPLDPSVTTTDVLCAGQCTGTADISISGGTAPYTYDWSNGGYISANENTLCAGTYRVDITDDLGCTGFVNFTISEPPSLNADFTTTEVSCFGLADGTASVTASGGTPGYTYSWSSGQSTASITGAAGNYSVTVYDANGCEFTETVEIEQPEALSLDTISTQKVSCPGEDDGQIIVSAAGGTSPYTYYLDANPGQTSTSFNNLAPGTYTIRVEDDRGCETAKTYTIGSGTISVTAPDDMRICFGEAITLTASGDFSQVFWNNGVTDGVQFIPNTLGVVTYIATVTNEEGCILKDTTLVTVERVPDPTITPAGPYCTSSAPEQLTAQDPNGIWSGTGMHPSGSGVFDPAAAGQGTHVIKYEFNGFCPVADSIEIQVNDQFDADIHPAGPFCELDDPVNLTSVTPGGTWFGPGIADTTRPTFDPGLAGGGNHKIYHLIDNECGELDSTIIQVTAATRVDIQTPPLFCHNSSAQNLTVNHSTGSWVATSYINSVGTFNPAGQVPGDYEVIYVPAGSCVVPDTALVTILDTLQTTPDTDNLDCFGDNDGTLTTQSTGGSGPYSYQWSNAATTQTINNLSAGVYNLTVSDTAGCQAFVSDTVYEPSALVFNQNETVVHPSCFGASDGSIQVHVAGGTPDGSGNYSYAISPVAGTNAGSGLFTDLLANNYTVVVTDDNGCTISTSALTLIEPNPLAVDTTINTAFCFRNDGSVVVNNISGGTAPFEVYWNGVLTPGQDLVNAFPGSYTLRIVDAQGCELTTSATVPNAGSPTITSGMTPVVCNGESTGSIFASGSGTVAPYSFVWRNINTQATYSGDSIANLPAGTYETTITDGNNCNNRDTVVLTEPSVVVANPVNDTTMCTGTVYQTQFDAAGGNGAPYSFSVNQSGSPITGPFATSTPGNFSFVAYDVRGCASSPENFTVNYYDSLEVNALNPAPICPGDEVDLNAAGTGGIGNYTFNWDNGMTGSQITVVSNPDGIAESYTVVLNDGCSLADTAVVDVTFHSYPNIKPQITPLSGCEPLEVTFNLNDQNYQHVSWDLGDGSEVENSLSFNHTYLEEGTYPINLNIISQEGCNLDSMLTNIGVEALPEGFISQQPNTITTIENDASFTIQTASVLNSVFWQLATIPEGDSVHTDLTTGRTLNYNFGQDTGRFLLSALMETPFGCTATIFKEIHVKVAEAVYLPSAFTPNGDGINDNFSVSWLNIEPTAFKVYIMNRWGNLIFQSADPDFSWDGNFQGSPVKPGVYPVKLVYKTLYDEEFTVHGVVNLIK